MEDKNIKCASEHTFLPFHEIQLAHITLSYHSVFHQRGQAHAVNEHTFYRMLDDASTLQ